MIIRAHHPAHRWVGILLIGLFALFAAAAHAQELTILQPAEGATIHDNAGKLQVSVTAYRAAAGYQAYVDGAPAGPVSLSPQLMLTGIDRGEHQLEVAAVDGAGQVLATSAPITFVMWQASRLFPNRN